jgi:hypothetical protein
MTAGKPYYVSAVMKEQGGGDNLAVRWQMPDGTDQAPVTATYLMPFGISFGPPVIAQNPTNTTAVEGGNAQFSVRLATFGVYSYRWQRNGSALAGATEPELVYGPVTLADQGARFRCMVTNNAGNAISGEAVLSVQPDTTPPTLVQVQNLGTTNLEVTFSEPVSVSSATVPSNFQLDNGVSVTGAAIGSSSRIVMLTTSPLTFGISYQLTVNGVKDQAQTPNTIALNSRITFTAVEYAPRDVGSPPIAGGSSASGGGFDVTGSGGLLELLIRSSSPGSGGTGISTYARAWNRLVQRIHLRRRGSWLGKRLPRAAVSFQPWLHPALWVVFRWCVARRTLLPRGADFSQRITPTPGCG